MQTDNQLIRRIKKKQDKKAADELIRRYYREIYAFTYRQTGERELALDLTQEIFITVLQGIYAFDEKKAGFRTWAYRVAANRITDYYRSKSYKKEKLQLPLQYANGIYTILATPVIKRKSCSCPCNGKQRRKRKKPCVIWRSIWCKKSRFAGSWILSFPMSANGFAFFRKNALRRKHLRRLQRRWILRRVP